MKYLIYLLVSFLTLSELAAQTSGAGGGWGILKDNEIQVKNFCSTPVSFSISSKKDKDFIIVKLSEKESKTFVLEERKLNIGEANGEATSLYFLICTNGQSKKCSPYKLIGGNRYFIFFSEAENAYRVFKGT